MPPDHPTLDPHPPCGTPPAQPLRLLLLSPDAARAARLAAACRRVDDRLRCIEAVDATSAVFAVPPDGVDLIAVDADLVAERGRAWLALVRRLAPHGSLLLLDGDEPRDVEHVQQAVARCIAERLCARHARGV